MRKIVLLVASMTVAIVLAGGVSLATTPVGTGEVALRGAEGRDAALDRALKELVAMRGGPARDHRGRAARPTQGGPLLRGP